LAAKGIKTAKTTGHRKSGYIVGHPDRQPAHVDRETEDILKIEREMGRELTTDAERQIEKRIVEIDRGITEYGEDPIMFTYVRLDHEIEDLEKELSTYGGRAADDLRERVKGLRSDLQESETPWTDE
jgi:hypothetical protein